MLTKQIELINRIRDQKEYDPEALANILTQFANCAADYETRSRLTVLGEQNDLSREALVHIGAYDKKPLSTATSTFDELAANGGLALDVEYGAVRFRGPACFDRPLAGAGGVSIKYGVAISAGDTDASTAHVLTGSGPWVSYVDVTPSDKAGTPTGAATVRVYLDRNDRQDPNIREDDIVAYMIDEDGDAIAWDSNLDGKVGESLEWRFDTDEAGYPKRGWYIANGAMVNGHTTYATGGGVLHSYSGAGAFANVGDVVSAAFTGLTGSVDSHSATGSGTTVNANNTTINLDTGFPGESTGDATETPFVTGITGDDFHLHSIDKTAIVSAIADHGAVTFGGTPTPTNVGRVGLLVQRMN